MSSYEFPSYNPRDLDRGKFKLAHRKEYYKRILKNEKYGRILHLTIKGFYQKEREGEGA